MLSLLMQNLDYLLFINGLSMFIVAGLSLHVARQAERRVDGFWLGIFCLFAAVQSWVELCKLSMAIDWLPVWGVPAMGVLTAISLLSLGQRARNVYTGVPWAIIVIIAGAVPAMFLLAFVPPLKVLYFLSAFMIGVGGIYATNPLLRASHVTDPAERFKLQALGSLLAAWSAGQMGGLITLGLEGLIEESWGPQATTNLVLFSTIAGVLLVPHVWWLMYVPVKAQKTPLAETYRLFPITFLLLVSVGWLAPTIGQTEFQREYRDWLLHEAIKTAATIPIQRVKELTFSEKDYGRPSFEQLREHLKAHGKFIMQKSIYTVAIRGGLMVFGPENIPPESKDASAPGEVYEQPSEELRAVFRTKKAIATEPYEDEYGRYVSAFAPILDPRSGNVLMVVGIDRKERDMLDEAARERFFWIVGFGVVTLLIITPLAVLSKRRTHNVSAKSFPVRHFESIVACTLGLILTGTLSYLAYRGETRSRAVEFERAAEAFTGKVMKDFDELSIGVEAIAHHYQSSVEPTLEDFRSFVSPLTSNSSLVALAWVPRVTHEERPALEAKMRALGFADFSIYEVDEKRQRIPSSVRPEYYPFLYFEPASGPGPGPGFDINSNAIRRNAMERSIMTGMTCASDPVLLLSDTGGKPGGVLVFRPVAKIEGSVRSAKLRGDRSWIKGFSVGVIRLNEILNSAAMSLQTHENDLEAGLVDLGMPKDKQLVASFPRGAADDWTLDETSETTRNNPMEQVYPVFAFGRAWGVILRPGQNFNYSHPIRYTWVLMIAGIFFTFIGTGIVELLRTRKERMEQEVDIRTRALKESEWRWQFALEGAGEGVWDWNVQTNIIYYSRRWKEMLGYTEAEIGNTLSEWDNRLHPEDKAKCYEDLKNHFSGKTPIFVSEHRIRCKEGNYIWVMDRGTVVEWTDDQKPLRVIGTLSDITRQKTIEAGLRESESRFRQFIEQAPTAIAMFDTQMHYLAASQRWLADYGLTGSDILGRSHYEVFPEIGDDWRRIHRHCLAGHVEHKEEDRFERKDGTTQWLQWEVRPWYNTMGQIAGLLMFTLDVTAQRTSREEVGRVRDRLNSTLQALPDLLMEIDFIGRIHEYRRPDPWTDLPHPKDLAGKNISDLFPKESVPIVLSAVRQASNDVHVHGVRCKLATTAQSDQSERWLELSISRRPTLTGEPPRFILLGRDVSEQARADEAVRKARDQAQDLNRQLQASMDRANELAKAAQKASQAKSEFLASMSHEIRTPMTAIMGYADMMLKPGRTPGEFQSWGKQIHRNADHLLSLINDLLDLSKIEAGQLLVNRTSLDLVEMLESVQALFEPTAREKTLDFKMVYATRVPRLIITDPVRFKQIILNLVNNAVKFTDHGGITIRVQLIRNPGDRAHLAVSIHDTGPGIAPDKRALLFRSFSQIHDPNAPRKPGTGLGLAISKKLALLLGGDISVESDPGVGSTFTVTLPMGKDDDLELVEGPLSVSEIGLSAPSRRNLPELSGKRVLVVDDNPDNQRIITFMLEELSAIILTAGNGQEAVDIMSRPGKNADLILMDMQMPVMDGYTATKTLRERGIATPIIALTAYAMSGDQEKCMKAGCSGFVSKPIVPEMLYKEITLQLAETKSSPMPADVTDNAPAPADNAENAEAAHAKNESNESVPQILNPELPPVMSSNPKFRALLKNYIMAMPETIEKLDEALAKKDLETLRFMTHRLKGTAGNYGFPKITEAAGSAEKLLIDQAQWDLVQKRIHRLIALLKAAAMVKLD
jgi:PAS domain S-box-containing protein